LMAVIHCGKAEDVLRILPDESVQCIVTSPPYWGLRDYGVEGQLGLEPSVSEYVERLVAIFREIRRVLRRDGTVWLNIGDKYATDGKWGGQSGSKHTAAQAGAEASRRRKSSGLEEKNIIAVPWRVGLALQDDGWYLRRPIIWWKPNVMPESVTDRPSGDYEYILLLTKSKRCYYDQYAVKEAASDPERQRSDVMGGKNGHLVRHSIGGTMTGSVTRNLRSVWRINTEGYPGAHFAIMPRLLAERCILAGTSAAGACLTCGRPLDRVIQKTRVPTRPGRRGKVADLKSANGAPHSGIVEPNSPYLHHNGDICGNRDPLRHVTEVMTIGWERRCDCGPSDPVPCVVLDPFAGTGTTGVVCEATGRRFIGIELNPKYVAMAERRIARPNAPCMRDERAEDLPLFRQIKECNPPPLPFTRPAE